MDKIIREMRNMIADVKDYVRTHGDHELTTLQQLTEWRAQVQKRWEIARSPGSDNSSEEASFAVVLAFLFQNMAYVTHEIRQRNPQAKGVSHLEGQQFAEHSVLFCREVRDLLGPAKATQLCHQVLDATLDDLQAYGLSELALNKMHTSGPEAALEYLRQASELQPDNPQFRVNWANASLQVEEKQSRRDQKRCVEIVEQLAATLNHGLHPSVPETLRQLLALPDLPSEIRQQAESLLQRIQGGIVTDSETTDLHRQYVQSLPGPVEEFLLASVTVASRADILRREPTLRPIAEIPCLVVRYRSCRPLQCTSRQLQRWVQLIKLGFACHLGLLGERSGLRLRSRPLPDQRDGLDGPICIWDTTFELHGGLGVALCRPVSGRSGESLEIEVCIAQLTCLPTLLRINHWVTDHIRILDFLRTGIQGRALTIRPGDPEFLFQIDASGNPTKRQAVTTRLDSEESLGRYSAVLLGMLGGAVAGGFFTPQEWKVGGALLGGMVGFLLLRVLVFGLRGLLLEDSTPSHDGADARGPDPKEDISHED